MDYGDPNLAAKDYSAGLVGGVGCKSDTGPTAPRAALTRNRMLAMIYKLGQSAERSWRRLRGFEWLAKVVEGIKFSDGIEVKMQTRVRSKHQPSRVAA